MGWSSSTGWNNAGWSSPVSGGEESAAAEAFLARTSGLDSTHVNAIIAFLNGLTDDGLFNVDGTTDYFNFLYLLATQDSTTALLDMTPNDCDATAVGSPSFTMDRGFTGVDSSTTIYIDTNFEATDIGSGDSTHMSIWSVTNFQSANIAMGADNSGVTYNYIFPRYTDDHTYAAVTELNVDESGNTGVSNTDGSGHYLVSHPSSITSDVYKNGSNTYSYTTTGTGRLIGTITISLIGATSFSGGHTGWGGQAAAASAGFGMNSTQVGNFYSRLRTYMTTIGVP